MVPERGGPQPDARPTRQSHQPARNPAMSSLGAARAFPSIRARAEAEVAKQRARPGIAEAYRMRKPTSSASAPLTGRQHSRCQTNPKARGNPNEPEPISNSNEPSCAGTRTNPSRSGSCPTPGALKSERTQAALERVQTRSLWNPNEPEPGRISPNSGARNPNEPKPVQSRPSPGALETERTQPLDILPTLAIRTNPSRPRIRTNPAASEIRSNQGGRDEPW